MSSSATKSTRQASQYRCGVGKWSPPCDQQSRDRALGPLLRLSNSKREKDNAKRGVSRSEDLSQVLLDWQSAPPLSQAEHWVTDPIAEVTPTREAWGCHSAGRHGRQQHSVGCCGDTRDADVERRGQTVDQFSRPGPHRQYPSVAQHRITLVPLGDMQFPQAILDMEAAEPHSNSKGGLHMHASFCPLPDLEQIRQIVEVWTSNSS
jgi:hypothetical protein